MKSSSLLSLLDDRQVHSGESLAKALGVSRTAIWKQIKKAQADGAEIRTIKGRGYQLMSALDFLDADHILDGLPPSLRSEIELTVLPEVDSTNREVAKRLSTAIGNTPVVLAEAQTAGRGRRGRSWSSPKGENLYMSLGISLAGGFQALEGLSLVLGVAVARALEEVGANPIGLKWPNDLYAFGKKLGGILVEIQGELQEGRVQVIAGIGLNVHMTRAESVDQPWTSLALAWDREDWRRSQIAAAMLAEISSSIRKFEEEGFAPFREQWQARDVFQDKPLTARDGDLSGLGGGIDAAGNYLVIKGDEFIAVKAGDISLRVQS